MNICVKHKKNQLNEKTGHQNKKNSNQNEITNKYFLCKFCGVLLNENDEVIFISFLKLNFIFKKKLIKLNRIL